MKLATKRNRKFLLAYVVIGLIPTVFLFLTGDRRLAGLLGLILACLILCHGVIYTVRDRQRGQHNDL